MREPSVDYSLYVCSDTELIGPRSMESCIEEAILGGATLIQLREKDISTREFYQKALHLHALTLHYHLPLIINDRVDIALAIGAEGVHLGQEDMDLITARRLLGTHAIIGISTLGSIELSQQAERDGADYIGVGAIFSTATKTNSLPIGLNSLAQICRSVSLPVVAIGGINLENSTEVWQTGVAGICVVSAILAQENIRAAAAAFRQQEVKK